MYKDIAFQSTPGFKAGRYRRHRSRGLPLRGFNPLPALRPGDTAEVSPAILLNAVSIHSRL